MPRWSPWAYRAYVLVLCLGWCAANQATLYVPFNTTATVGPDGPWNFITLSVGHSPASNVSFFPSVDCPYSLLVDGRNCDLNASQCLGSMDYYNSNSAGETTNPYHLKNNTEDSSVFMDRDGLAHFSGPGYYWMESVHDPFNFDNSTVFITRNITSTVGTKQYRPISLLALEHANWGSKIGGGPDPPTAWTIPWTFWEANKPNGPPIGFGLHVGAAAFGQSGSLHIGGYDQSRVLGQGLAGGMGGGAFLAINNISFGTSSGRSPWAGRNDMPSTFALMPTGQKSSNVTIQPMVPYISIPRIWANAMADFLPVTYDPETNLFLWNVNDPAYHDIVSSPSYMEITFAGGIPCSVKLPFATLNLTLDTPLKSKPTPYLPIYPRDDKIVFGRAFLQSVYYGQVAIPDAAYQYVAQAPGPVVNASTLPQPIAWNGFNPTMTGSSSGPKWEDTWAGILKPLEDSKPGQPQGTGSQAATSSSSPQDQPSQSHGLSGGAIAGIVIGVVLAVALMALAAWLFVRRRVQTRPDLAELPQQRLSVIQKGIASPSGWTSSGITSPMSTAQQLDSRETFLEIDGAARHEAAGTHAPEKDRVVRHELSDTSIPDRDDVLRYEMPASPVILEAQADTPPPVPPKDY